MGWMFGYTAINQPLSNFDMSSVENVRAYLCCVQLDEKPDSDFLFLPALTSDIRHVRICIILQPEPVSFRIQLELEFKCRKHWAWGRICC